MINIGFLVLFAILGAGLGVGYNFLFVKRYPEDRRKGGYAGTVFVFVLTTVVLFSVISVKMYIDRAVPAKAAEMADKIKKEHSDVGFVRSGLDLTEINNDVSRLNNAVADLKYTLPSHEELGLAKSLYNFLVNIAVKQLQKNLTIKNNAEKAAAGFADENNYLTISSIYNGLQRRVVKIISIALFVFASIFVIIFLIYIIKSLRIAFKGNKS